MKHDPILNKIVKKNIKIIKTFSVSFTFPFVNLVTFFFFFSFQFFIQGRNTRKDWYVCVFLSSLFTPEKKLDIFNWKNNKCVLFASIFFIFFCYLNGNYEQKNISGFNYYFFIVYNDEKYFNWNFVNWSLIICFNDKKS